MSENRLLPFAFARDYSILASRRSDVEGAPVELKVSAETKQTAILEAGRRFGRIHLNLLTHGQLLEEIARAYAGSGGDAADVVGEVESDMDLAKLMQDMPAIEDLLESADDAPVIRMINALLTQALREGASDIHIEPFEQISVVRFRVDGALRDVIRPKKAIHASLVSRIKIHGATRYCGKTFAAGWPYYFTNWWKTSRCQGVDAANRTWRTGCFTIAR